MFEGLKQKLRSVQEAFGSSLTAEEPPSSLPALPQKKEESPSLARKVKVLVTEGELVVGEKEIQAPLQELEMVLLENDVALPVTDEILRAVRERLVGTHRRIGQSPDALVRKALREALLQVLGKGFDLLEFCRGHEKPVRILFTGVNGTGKTTTVAKVGHYLKEHGCSVVIASGDTFRAGALTQLGTHAERLGIKVIQHQQGGDPSAVLYDAVEYAGAHGMDVVLADSAGRFHNRVNLMNQLEKMKRVMQPDLVVYVDEAVAGNDAVIRAQEFAELVGTDAVILTKADMDSRGGAAVSVAHTVGKPIIFLGTGQGYGDIVPFLPEQVVADLVGE
ncbi:MAG: signal recognition particle-docking protein FtsY [Methanomicrobiales archaeon]|nr:signal recognition particle-docking protein FtsY [Methanomicrobiales archaeon]